MSVLKEQMGEAFHTALRKGCDSTGRRLFGIYFIFAPMRCMLISFSIS